MNANLGFTVLLLTLGFVPHIIAGPLWNKELAQTQGFKNLLKTIGTSLCKAAYDDSNPNAVAETMRTWFEVDEAQIETVKDFFKRFGSYLCNDITDDSTSTGGSSEKLSSQTLIAPRLPWGTWRSLGASQKLTNAKMQGRRFSKLFNTVGSALCKAAYNDNNPNALAEVFPSMNEVEIQGVKDFVKRFGSILCNSITNENGGPNEQSFDSAKQFTWTRQDLSKVEMQGFMNLAKKVGSAFCKAAYDGKNPSAIVESLGITDETEIQQITNFLKRFGANLCDYVTEGSDEAGGQGGWETQREISAEEQGFFRKIGSALCGAALDKNPTAAAQLFGLTDEAEVQKFTDFLKRFGSNLCDSITDDNNRGVASRPVFIEQSVMPISWPGYAQKQGISKFAKKIGSALCGAAYNPSAVAESAIAQGLIDEAGSQKFKDFVKRFGANLCDYITEDNGKMKVTEQGLAQELMAALQ